MGEYRLAVLPGDGIGPEVTAEAMRVLQAVARSFGHTFTMTERLVGQVALAREGAPVSEETIALCRNSDAVLFGAVTTLEAASARVHHESAILQLRKALDLFANLRPVRPLPALLSASPLRPERLRDVDLLVIRELTGGIYFGQPKAIHEAEPGGAGASAVDTMTYSEEEIERVARMAFELACGRRSHVTSVDKANVLQCSQLWRRVVERVARDYPDVELHHLLVDACAMELLRRPRDFDVIVSENLFGDVLTDEASMLAGSIGLLPSASLGARRTPHGTFGLYEPIHGSAPDIAGQAKANPLAAILSAALLLRHSLGLATEASAVEQAVAEVIGAGFRTPDIADPDTAPTMILSTPAMGAAVMRRIDGE
ncbi:MAG: 3-isopropylmalate dehydrogenase [Ktedonobacterales bacterium]